MALILGIDVSGPKGLVILSEHGNYIDSISSNDAMQHASFLQPAIRKLLSDNNRQLQELTAIALSNGPGSYTGLRVGLASAKGLCFALNIPLITINSLQLMAFGVKQKNAFSTNDTEWLHKIDNLRQYLICPMLDARRMEVFFALYDAEATPLIQASAGVVDDAFLSDWLSGNFILFTGSGSFKWEKICTDSNAVFLPEPDTEMAFSYLSYQLYLRKDFADLVSAEPFYSKAFYNAAQPKLRGESH